MCTLAQMHAIREPESNLDVTSWHLHAGIVPPKPSFSKRRTRPPRIRVPNREQVLFTVDHQRFLGVVQRLSLTGGSAILTKGPIPHGTWGDMVLNTVFGKVTAQVEFLQTGADGIPLAQAFRFVAMDDESTQRFANAARQMEAAGFSDEPRNVTTRVSRDTLDQLLSSVRRLANLVVSRK